MSIFATNYDSTLVVTPTAASVMPVQQSGVGKYQRLDAIAPFNGPFRYCCISGNLGTLSSLGTSAVATANATYVSPVYIRHPMLITGIGFLNGTTVGTDRVIYGLYNAAGTTLLASTTAASNGTVTANANTFQEIAFSPGTLQINTLGLYWIAWQANGTTTTRRSIAAATWIDVQTLSAGTAGSAGVLATTITPPTSFTADTGPIGYVYGV